MKVIFNNTLHLNETAINTPFMIEQTPIGIVLEVNDETFTVEIWDRFCGYEFNKKSRFIDGVYLSTKEQYTYDELMKLKPDKFMNKKDNTPDIDCDVIRGHRLTDAESMRIMCPDLPEIDEKELEEVISPFINGGKNDSKNIN